MKLLQIHILLYFLPLLKPRVPKLFLFKNEICHLSYSTQLIIQLPRNYYRLLNRKQIFTLPSWKKKMITIHSLPQLFSFIPTFP